MNIVEIINELNKTLSQKYSDFLGSYLYGSRAKGTFKENSDIDIVALFDNVDRQKNREISGILCDLEYKYNVFIDLQAFTPEMLKYNPFYYEEVTQKGIYYAT